MTIYTYISLNTEGKKYIFGYIGTLFSGRLHPCMKEWQKEYTYRALKQYADYISISPEQCSYIYIYIYIIYIYIHYLLNPGDV